MNDQVSLSERTNYLRVEITRWVDDADPGFVECRPVDTAGTAHFFIEKVPVVTTSPMDAKSDFPQPGSIACRIIERREQSGRVVIVVDTQHPWDVESTLGEHRFMVFDDQVVSA